AHETAESVFFERGDLHPFASFLVLCTRSATCSQVLRALSTDHAYGHHSTGSWGLDRAASLGQRRKRRENGPAGSKHSLLKEYKTVKYDFMATPRGAFPRSTRPTLGYRALGRALSTRASGFEAETAWARRGARREGLACRRAGR